MTAVASLLFFLGWKVSIGHYHLDTNDKHSTYTGILLFITGALMSGTLIGMLKNEHYMDEKPALVCFKDMYSLISVETAPYHHCRWL